MAWRVALRTSDFIARHGGDEFSILLPETSQDVAIPIVERLRSATPMDQTCSVGMAFLEPTELSEDVVRRADRALYEAKREGRDRAVVSQAPLLR